MKAMHLFIFGILLNFLTLGLTQEYKWQEYIYWMGKASNP